MLAVFRSERPSAVICTVVILSLLVTLVSVDTSTGHD
jgi:hypothetical protein